MAVKASIQITISKVIDVYAVYRYYKLQSSTLAKPSKPATNPPSGWSDTEPAYVSRSTNTLYFVDCNVYSDKSFSFSEVSKSSSYEAAKDAWNKANAALNNTVVSVDIEYYLSTSATSLAGGSWATTAPTWVNGKYMWSRTVTVDGAGNKTYSPSQNGVCIAGAKGDTGAKGDKGDKGATGETGAQGPQGGTGATGKGVTSIVEQYYKSTSATSLTGGSWSETYPGWENGKYIWTRSVITYTDKTSTTTTAVCVTGEKGQTGAKGDKGETGPQGPTGAMGETLSNGKLLYKDVMFAEGTNGIEVYNNSGNGTVTVTRQAKSSDNPCGDYELAIANTGTASPSCGGFRWSNLSRANAVFIYRIIAKIPTGRNIIWAANSFGTGSSFKWLTSQAGTGQFTEYILKATCGASGSFSIIGYFYINGSVGTTSAPVKWYVAYAGVWDMTDYEDFDGEIKEVEKGLRETISEKSTDIINECQGIILKALETYTSTGEFDEFKRITENQLKILSDSTTLQIKQTTEDLNKVNADLQNKFNTITKYFTFDINGLTIGKLDNPYKVIIDNDRYSMTVNDVEVMWIANGKVYTSEIEVTKVLRLIDYMIDKDSAGNVNCTYIGGDS